MLGKQKNPFFWVKMEKKIPKKEIYVIKFLILVTRGKKKNPSENYKGYMVIYIYIYILTAL
jgi:rRNA processing protein Gar1